MPPASHHGVTFGEAARVWARVAALSFGGPAGQIATMHRIIVDEKKWIGEARFLHALNYCMLLPGPEAQQLATYIGWLMHGWRGGLLAGGLFVLPGFVAILGLSILYALYKDLTVVTGIFFGLKAAVLAVVVEAVIRIGRKVLKNGVMVAIAALAFVGIFFFEVPFPIIVLGAGVVGLVGGRLRPDVFHVIKGHKVAGEAGGGAEGGALLDDAPPHAALTARHALGVLAIWLPLWLVPIGVIVALLGREHVLAQEAIFFSKAALVTFGGAYSVLAYVGQQAVEVYGWLEPGEMLDGLGMAETTPGPLIMVVQFVGFLGAFRHPEPFSPLAAGVLGAVTTTWVTFAPCFLWIFLGAPYIERLRDNRVLSSGLSAITAAVVGVILNLAVWFAVHVFFKEVGETHVGPGGVLRLLVPRWETVDWAAIAIAVGAGVMLLRFKVRMLQTLAAATATGLAWVLVAGV